MMNWWYQQVPDILFHMAYGSAVIYIWTNRESLIRCQQSNFPNSGLDDSRPGVRLQGGQYVSLICVSGRSKVSTRYMELDDR